MLSSVEINAQVLGLDASLKDVQSVADTIKEKWKSVRERMMSTERRGQLSTSITLSMRCS